jgi:hypothetical protein
MVSAIALSSLEGCSSGANCPAYLVHALQVDVVDASGSPVCDVTVHAEGPDLDDERALSASECTYFGGLSAGQYKVSILRAGGLLVQRQIVVSTGDCGIMMQKVVLQSP